VNDVAIRLEHVDLLNGLDGLGVQLLEGLLKLLVIGTGAGGRTLDLASGGTLSTKQVSWLAADIGGGRRFAFAFE
jgi:hypothetical protein